MKEATRSFCLAIIFAIPAFWFCFDEPNPKVPLLAGAFAGFGGVWLVNRLIGVAPMLRDRLN